MSQSGSFGVIKTSEYNHLRRGDLERLQKDDPSHTLVTTLYLAMLLWEVGRKIPGVVKDPMYEAKF